MGRGDSELQGIIYPLSVFPAQPVPFLRQQPRLFFRTRAHDSSNRAIIFSVVGENTECFLSHSLPAVETDTAIKTLLSDKCSDGDDDAMDTDAEQRLLEDALADPEALSMFDALIDDDDLPDVSGGEDFS